MTHEQKSGVRLSSETTNGLIVFAVLGIVALRIGQHDFPALHTILDTGMFLLSGILAASFWGVGQRSEHPFPKWVAISFGLNATLEFVHVLVAVEWTGALAPISAAAASLRPASWPPSTHLLPLGIGAAIASTRFAKPRTGLFAAALLASGILLMWVFHEVPRYTDPTWLGITRPTLVAAPILWAMVAVMGWRSRGRDRAVSPMVALAAVLCVANVAMLYSRAPHDSAAMVAHLGKVLGYLSLLLWLTRMASIDMTERLQAERALADLNRDLEARVTDRTERLQAANDTLAAEIRERQLAEDKVTAQVQRLNLLHRITRAIDERHDLASIFQVVIRSLEDHLPIDFGCVCLYDREANQLTVTSVGVRSEPVALDLAMPANARIPIDENGLSRCLRGEFVYEHDVSEVAMPFAQRLTRGGLRSLVVAPLLTESQVFGVLIAARREVDRFTSGECEFLRQLSEHVALAAHHAQLYRSLQAAYDDLRQTQAAVMQQERLRALGQMASGIAHDINNAITPVMLYAETLLERESGLSAKGRSHLETIRRAVEDVAHTVSRMREFYRQRETALDLAVVQLNDLVPEVADLTRARWSDMPQQKGVVLDMHTELDPDLPAVMAVASEIREALTNLVFNAVDAMPEGGTMTLRTRVANGPSGSNGVVIEVADTGVGMDEETRRRCLEPFFTTKGERGTGLGLAMVYGVARRHGADVEIDSAPGAGTVVRMCFAAATATAGVASVAKLVAVVPRQRVLLVDDDPVLLQSLRDILETDGHVVTVANQGQDGIDAFRAALRGEQPFDLVITDLGMPYVDGRKVASSIEADSPETPIILLTGWGHRLNSEGDVPPGVDCVLSKPPKLSELREALARLCTRPSPTLASERPV